MNEINSLIKDIKDGQYSERFLEIYVDSRHAELQPSRYISALERFDALYGDCPVRIYSAPGRSEVGGNHTDHQHGKVLAASINLDAIAVVSPTSDNLIRIVSDESPELVIDCNANLSPSSSMYGTTKSIILGILKGFLDRGLAIGGFKAFITSDVLIGAGLSSSAAFETLIGTILSHLYNDACVTSTDIAIIGQYAENVHFGKPCGLMDQLACATGGMVYIDFADVEKPVIKPVDPSCINNKYALCITNTFGSHADLTDDYAAIPAEMKAVAACFGRELLTDLTLEELLSNATNVRQQCGDRALLRAIHYITENDRVTNELIAITDNKPEEFIANVRASGNSSFKYLQNIYSNSNVKVQNVSLALAVSDTVLGYNEACRVHGGGFAGTIQAFVTKDNVTNYCNAMNQLFDSACACRVLSIRPFGGIEL